MLAQSLMKLVDNAKAAGTPLKLKVRLQTHFYKRFVLPVVYLSLWRISFRSDFHRCTKELLRISMITASCF